MTRTSIYDLHSTWESRLGETVFLQGWVRQARDSATVAFLQVNDGSDFEDVQVVIGAQVTNFEELSKVTIGSSVEVTAIVKKSEGGGQPYELSASSVTVLGRADESNPIQKKRHTFEYLRTVAHLRPRTNTFMAVFRVRSILEQAIHEFFALRRFSLVNTPIITTNDCEGAGELFRVSTKEKLGDKELLGREAYLTVSGQLALESFCFALGNVYTFGPAFRAENSNTKRHACEFWMLEPELAFTDLVGNMGIAEELLRFLAGVMLERAPKEVAFFEAHILPGLTARLQSLTGEAYQRMTYTEAITKLQDSGVTFEIKPEWGIDLQTEHERYLTDEVFKCPVFVTDYPKNIKAFYMRQNEDGKTVRAMDLLVPGVGELIGGSQREERMEKLRERMGEMHLSEEEYDWYLDVRRFGTFVHSGFGLGFERLLMYFTGMENIRDVIPYPRTPNSIEY